MSSSSPIILLSSTGSPSSPPSTSSIVSSASPSTSVGPLFSVMMPSLVSGTSQTIVELVNEATNTVSINDASERLVTATVHQSLSCDNCLPFSMEIVYLFLGMVIVVVGVLGNAFVVAVIVTDRKLLNSSVNLFLLNLAVADMGNLLFSAPDLIMAIFNLGWVLPVPLCPTIRFVQEYFLYASVLLQMSIGVERYMAICTPLRMQRFSRRTTAIVLALAWGCAALFAAPFGVYMRVKRALDPTIRPNTYCAWDTKIVSASFLSHLHWANFLVVYGIPLVMLTVLYTIMCRRLWGKECSMIANEAQQMAILRLRRSVVKMLVLSILIYFICYTPIQALSLMSTKPVHIVRVLLHLMTLASSAANPIVYIICCRHFHMRFLQMLGWMTHCCSPTPEKYQTVITDTEKYARMSIIAQTASEKRRQIRRVVQHSSDDVSISVCLIQKNIEPSCEPSRDVERFSRRWPPQQLLRGASHEMHKQGSTDSLRFVEPPALRQLADGSIEIEAAFDCAPLPDVVWRRNGETIMSELNDVDGRYRTTFSRRDDDVCVSTLRVENAGEKDAGTFQCDVAVPSDGTTTTALIQVTPSFFKRPFFLQKTGFHMRDNGRIVIMDFRVRSPCKVTAEWSADGRPLPKSSSVNFVHRKENADTYYGALILCRPSASSTSSTASSSSSSSLSMSSSGHPSAMVYECAIKNEFGQIVASYGQEQSSGLPLLIRPLSGRHIVKDRVHIALFDVGFLSATTPTITWWSARGSQAYKNGKPLSESGRVKMQLVRDAVDDSYTARMQMANWGERDAGRYTCTIENAMGRTAADVVFREVDHVGQLMSRLFSPKFERRGSSPC